MRLLGLEDPCDGVARASRAIERSGSVAQPRVGVERFDAGDREQLAAPLVADEADTRKGLEAAAEAAPRSAYPLGDRADPPARRGIEMEDAIGLGVAQRTQHDRVRLERAAHAILVK